MKFAVSIVALTLLATAVGAKEDNPIGATDEQIDKCVESSGIDRKLARKRVPDIPWDDNFKCYFACIVQARETLSPDGTINIDKMKSNIPDYEGKKDLLAAAEKCLDAGKEGTNICEKAYHSHLCMIHYL